MNKVVECTRAFLADTVRRGARYDCTQPEVYDQFLHDVADEMNSAGYVTTLVTTYDVDRAIKSTADLRGHPMLQRDRYLSDATEVPLPPTTTAATTPSSLLATLWRTFTVTAAPPSLHEAERNEARERRIVDETARIIELVRTKLLAALETGTYHAYSSAADDDWYIVVNVVCASEADAAVNRALESEYTHEQALQHRHRPYLASRLVYNQDASRRKHALGKLLVFRFPSDPATVTPEEALRLQ